MGVHGPRPPLHDSCRFRVDPHRNADWKLSPQIVFAILLLFFTVIEIRILCRHCPYDARSGLTIRCFANYGLPTFWRYQPEPMNGFEKTGLIICFLFIGFIPIFTEAYAVWFLSSSYRPYGLALLLGFIGGHHHQRCGCGILSLPSQPVLLPSLCQFQLPLQQGLRSRFR